MVGPVHRLNLFIKKIKSFNITIMKTGYSYYRNLLLKQNRFTPLAVTFFFSGIWDFVAAFMYIFFIGNGRVLDELQMDSFYAVFLGSFFLCFAYIQIMSSLNIRRYAFNVGCLIIGRLFYVVVLYSYMLLKNNFPVTFWFTGIIDLSFVILYFHFSFLANLPLSFLFFPDKPGNRS